MDDKTFKGMTERDLLVMLNERVGNLQATISDGEKRLDKLEVEVLTFKTEINTRIKVYTAIATTIGTAAGSLIMHFLK